MRRIAAVIAATFLSVATVFTTDITLARADDDGRAQLNPCAVPNEIVGSFQETGWRIWVAATCPVNSNQYPYVVWENWIEQGQLYPTDPSQGLKVPNSGVTTAAITLCRNGRPFGRNSRSRAGIHIRGMDHQQPRSRWVPNTMKAVVKAGA